MIFSLACVSELSFAVSVCDSILVKPSMIANANMAARTRHIAIVVFFDGTEEGTVTEALSFRAAETPRSECLTIMPRIELGFVTERIVDAACMQLVMTPEQAAYVAWRNPRIRLFTQYLWRDEPKSHGGYER